MHLRYERVRPEDKGEMQGDMLQLELNTQNLTDADERRILSVLSYPGIDRRKKSSRGNYYVR